MLIIGVLGAKVILMHMGNECIFVGSAAAISYQMGNAIHTHDTSKTAAFALASGVMME